MMEWRLRIVCLIVGLTSFGVLLAAMDMEKGNIMYLCSLNQSTRIHHLCKGDVLRCPHIQGHGINSWKVIKVIEYTTEMDENSPALLAGVISALIIVAVFSNFVTFYLTKRKYKPKRDYAQLRGENGSIIPEISYLNMLLKFESYTDIQLNRIIDVERKRLEHTIVNCVKEVSQMLYDETAFTHTENEEIRNLAERDRRKEACQLVFDILLQKGSREIRTFFEIFLRLQNPREPKVVLTEIHYVGEEIDEIGRMHQNRLRMKNKMIIVKTARPKTMRKLLPCENYINITKVSSLRVRSLVENQLRARGREREELQKLSLENNLKEINLTELLNNSSTERQNSTTTAVIGEVGIGKSTMLQKIIYDWSIGKIYQQFKYVFPFKVRQLNQMHESTCLNSLILDSFPSFENQLEKLWKQPENILFIFDDFDQIEPTISFTDTERDTDQQINCNHPECSCEISDIVRSLMKGQLLKGCSVLVTSRPWKLETLAQARVHLTAEILGFNSKQMGEFFLQYFDDKQRAADIMKYFEHNEMLYTMCYNPLFCSVLCSLVETHIPKVATALQFIPSAQVFSAYFTSLSQRSEGATMDSHSDLLKLGDLAYEGICNNIVLFKSGQLKNHNLEYSSLISVFMRAIPGKEPCTFVYAFTHSVMQDFAAARAKFRNAPEKGLIELLQNWCTDNRFKVISCFLVSLLARYSVDLPGNKLSESLPETHVQVSSWLKDKCKGVAHNLEGSQSQNMLLRILHYVLELGDKNLTMDTLSPLKIMKFTECQLQLYDCAVLSRQLMDVDQIEELNLSSCGIQKEGIYELELVLHKLKILRLNENRIGDVGAIRLSDVLKKKDCKIQILELKSNSLTDDCVEHLVDALRVNRSLMQLDLSNDGPNGEQANKLTDISIPALKQLSRNDVNLKELRWMHNQFSTDGKRSLNSLYPTDV
ncbi:NACHT, LRR and PYD domains-containing protein 12-like isoform X3 [Scyliorhinus torazame]